MANYFTSDWHLNEQRIFDFNPFFRPFKSVKEQNDTIINKCNNIVNQNDTLYHIGDVVMDLDGLKLLDRIKCKNRVLIVGNYDDDKLDELSNYFDSVHTMQQILIGKTKWILNHYPAKANPVEWNIVGHIHGLWKVQPNMINVGVDAWNYEPLSEKQIKFVQEAITKYYDVNVFPPRYNANII